MAKFTGKGAQLLLKTSGATPAYVAVGQIQEIGNIDIKADEVDVTTLDAGDYRDFIQGFKDPGESQITVMFDPAMADQDDSADGLWGIFDRGEVRDWAIRFNSSGTGGATWGSFKAFIRDWSFDALNASNPQTVKPTLRLTTAITLSDTEPAISATPDHAMSGHATPGHLATGGGMPQGTPARGRFAEVL